MTTFEKLALQTFYPLSVAASVILTPLLLAWTHNAGLVAVLNSLFNAVTMTLFMLLLRRSIRLSEQVTESNALTRQLRENLRALSRRTDRTEQIQAHDLRMQARDVAKEIARQTRLVPERPAPGPITKANQGL